MPNNMAVPLPHFLCAEGVEKAEAKNIICTGFNPRRAVHMDGQHDDAFWATIEPSGQQFVATWWRGKTKNVPPGQKQSEKFANRSDAAQHVYDVVGPSHGQTIFWQPGSDWKPGEVEYVQ
jgi:hypothetical protein